MPALAVRLAARHGVILRSKETEAQLFAVLNRPAFARIIADDSRRHFQEIMSQAELCHVTERIAVCRDPTDDKFLELALAGQADLIVSGDADLLVLNPFRGIPILGAAAFTQRFGAA